MTNGRILLAHSPSQNVTEGLMAADFLLVDNFAATAQLSQQASCSRARLDTRLHSIYHCLSCLCCALFHLDFAMLWRRRLIANGGQCCLYASLCIAQKLQPCTFFSSNRTAHALGVSFGPILRTGTNLSCVSTSSKLCATAHVYIFSRWCFFRKYGLPVLCQQEIWNRSAPHLL